MNKFNCLLLTVLVTFAISCKKDRTPSLDEEFSKCRLSNGALHVVKDNALHVFDLDAANEEFRMTVKEESSDIKERPPRHMMKVILSHTTMMNPE